MSTIFEVKVVPSSGQNKWILDKSGKLKCYLKNPPEKGLANKELAFLVAKYLSIPRDEVEIISGANSRNKRVKILLNITFIQLLDLFGLALQASLFK